ncbi:MAG: Allophanate hydrolase (EC [uncultured Paraburkholderia sp.]|uniref:allophanate hydrolase n=1 Tax=uncultured Paraburkholderia sp. TaxID=1822466 RepID=UPI0025914B4B|nr:allophanate hydrolase [uncultured Paraburkholderia sp.]CAH2899035.1 MAG: Allophanate hydrolase (EC [uncultured Paraburkholderia sp.]CAH2924776.1 MAG: Allophanate hydrolase (EC [uncultured Paraburkholderia sp.]
MSSFDLRIPALRNAYRAGTLAPRTLVNELLRKAAELNAEFNLFIHLLTEEEVAPYLDWLDRQNSENLPLYGIPFAIKDNIDLAGIETTAACPAFAYTPIESATLVAQLIALGAIPLGKTNLDQFATGLNGTRSPYGKCRNSVHPDYPSGGSSAGSSLAVALGVASFALGTDTAGSGRVPAGLNNLVGLKPTKGILSTAGVVPACRTLDCVTFFTATAEEASELLSLTALTDPRDAYSRKNPQWNSARAFGAPVAFRFGVPSQLEFAGCTESPALFAKARAMLEAAGGEAVEIDFAPFVEAANLLYQGPWVAERYSVAGELMSTTPSAVLPVIRDVLAKAPGATAVELFQAQYRLQALKARCDALIDTLDCVLTPTYPRPVTLAELEQDPIGPNSLLGYYTNFMNLLDYAAVATPTAFMKNGLPWGVTVFGRAFTDQYLLGVADLLQRTSGVECVGGNAIALSEERKATNDRMLVAVCGAHMQGLPLNKDMLSRGALLQQSTQTAPRYRLAALPASPDGTRRPGLWRVADGGVKLEVEVWKMPASEFGSLIATVPSPLALGKIELADGSWVTGFLCEPYGVQAGTDISEFGGWRAWLAHDRALDA